MANESMRYDIVLGFKADVEAAKKQLYDLQQNIDRFTNRDFELNFSTKNLRAGYDSTSKQLITFNKLLNKSFNVDTGKVNLNKLIAETKAYNIDIGRLTSNLYAIKDAYPEAGEAFEHITNLLAEGDTKAISFSKSIQRMGEQLIRTAKIQLSYAVLDQFTGVFRDSYNYAQELNKSLNNIRIVTNKSKTDMSKFAVEANKAAKALSTTTTAYTDAALIYYQQGLSDDAVKERTDATVKLANVTGQSASEVSSYMTAIWNNYDNGSKSLEYYADVITALGAATASSSEEIAQGLSQFSAVANTVGLSYEYASSALATVVAQTRLSADTVGTSFKTIFARLQSLNLGETLDDDTTLTKYTKAMDKVGVSIKNQDGTLKSMDAILDSLGTKWSQLNQEQKNGLAYTVAGARQYTNFIALMDNWQQMQANVSIAELSEGTLTRQQRIYEESWEAANKRIKASFESIYDTIINDDAFIFLTNSFSKLLDLVNQVVKGFGGFEGTLGILLSTSTKLFKTPLTGWISSLISTINQGYSIINKAAEDLQEDNINTRYDATEIRNSTLRTGYVQSIDEVRRQREAALSATNNLDREQINNKYHELEQNIKDSYRQQDTISTLMNDRESFNTDFNGFIRAIQYQDRANISNSKFTENEINRIINEVLEMNRNSIPDSMFRGSNRSIASNLLSEYYNFGDNAREMLENATQLRDRYTEALDYSSVQQYPEQVQAIQTQIDDLNNAIEILTRYANNTENNNTSNTQQENQPSTIENTIELDPIVENRLSTIIELLHQLVDLKYYSVDSTAQDRRDERSAERNETRANREAQELAEEEAERQRALNRERNARDQQARQNITTLAETKRTQTINQLNTKITKLDNDTIQRIVNQFNTSNPNQRVTFNDRNKQLNFRANAFDAVGNIRNEYQQLISTIEEAANQADLFNDRVYTIDPSPQSKYDQMAASLTNAADLLGSMISLNATLGNTIDDLVNADFDNLIGDISALSMSLGNGVNTLLKLKNLMGERWPFEAGDQIGSALKNLIGHPIQSLKSGLSSVKTLFLGTAGAATTTGAAGAGAFALISAGAKAAVSAIADVLLPLIAVQAILAAIKIGWKFLVKFIEENDPEKQLQKLVDTTEDLKNKANEAAQAYDNINSSINNLDSALDKIKNLTEGTIEWKNAIADNNAQVWELLKMYDLLGDPRYYNIDEKGIVTLTDLGKDTINNKAYGEKMTAQGAANLSNYELAQEKANRNTDWTTALNKVLNEDTNIYDITPEELAEEDFPEFSTFWNATEEALLSALLDSSNLKFEDKDDFKQKVASKNQEVADSAYFENLADILFPNNKKSELVKDLEAAAVTESKAQEQLNLAAGQIASTALNLQFFQQSIPDQIYKDEDFLAYFRSTVNKVEQDVGTAKEWSHQNRSEDVKNLYNAEKVEKTDEGWKIDGEDYTFEMVRAQAVVKQIQEQYGEELTKVARDITKEKGYKNPTDYLNDTTNGRIQKDIDTWKLDKNAIEDATEALYELYKAQGMTEDEAKRIVVANEKLNAAYSDLIDKFKDYNIALKNNERYSTEYQTTLKSLRKDVAALFDINEDLVSEDFLTDPKTLKLLEQFQYGNLAAVDELQKRLSYNLELDISEDSKTKVTNALDYFYTETANNPLELGMTLDTEGPLKQLYDFFTEMIRSGEMTAEQVTAALSSIGIEPEIEWEEVELKSDKLTNYSGELRVVLADGSEDTITHFSNDMQLTDVSRILMPKINAKSSYRGKPSSTISGTNKQKAAKNAASNKPKTKNVDDEKKRYYEINQELAKLNDQLNKITKAKDRAFGKEKLGYLDQEINKYKDLEKAQQKYLDEVNSYLSSDMGKLAAYGAQFNDDGTLANYDELISKQIAQYNATANAENSNADEVYSNFTKALSNYEESLSKSREVLNQLIDYQNQIYDLKLEKIVYKVEYKVEINDKDLERLEWLLNNISDKAFKSAESIALMSKQMADYQSSFETVNKGIDEWFANHTEISAEMKDAFLNGTLSADELASKLNTLTEAEKEQLYNWSSQLMQLVDNMEQVKQAIQDQLLKSFDDLTEKVDEQVNRLDTLNQIMSSYIEIAKLVGKENLGVSNELMKQMRQSTINLSTQQVNIMRKEYEAAKEELDKLMATPGVETETIAQVKQRVSEIYANLLSQTQETVSAIQQMFADTMQDIADDFSKRMGGLYGSISELQLAYDRQKDLNEGYLETYQKSYELAKLTREINNSINDTDSLKGKQLLLSLEDEITQRQADRTKMSEYELNFLQKKYELYQAQIALEEAQNAKSQVRMTRDANGNMSYTYTADQEAIDKAEQGYNDALYNLMNLNQEQLQANQEKILSIVSEYYQNLIDLGYDQEEAAALANEHYQTLMAQAREEMDLTLGHASWIVEEMGVEEDLLIDKFDETALAHITGTTTMEEYIDNWEAAVAAAISATNTNYQDFQSNLASCLEAAELDSGAFAEAVDADMSEVNNALIETEEETDKLVDTFKSDFDKALGHVRDFDSQYAKFLENMRKNTNTLIEALNNLIKGFAELDGKAANVISTSQTRIQAAEVELETQSSGSGTPKESSGDGAARTYYFGNALLGQFTDARYAYSAVEKMTGIRSASIDRMISTMPNGPIYVWKDAKGRGYVGKTEPYSIPDAREIRQFDTGGYTGDWDSKEGKLAVLHQKELVLNENDTSNILEVVNIVRNLADTISNLTYRDKMESLLNNIQTIYDHIYDNIKIENSQNMDQYITIQADFPSVSSQVEIEAAFDNILLHASQYANRKA